jgi:hypothetical protein
MNYKGRRRGGRKRRIYLYDSIFIKSGDKRVPLITIENKILL